jgi:predicted DNA-binding protein
VVDDHRVSKGAEKRDIRFSLRIMSSLHTRLRKVADADRRTMADFTLIALENAIDEFEAAVAAKKAEQAARAAALGESLQPSRASTDRQEDHRVAGSARMSVTEIETSESNVGCSRSLLCNVRMLV